MDASFIDKFFIPEVAFGDTRFTVTTPGGQRVPFSDIHQFRTRTVAEQKLPDEQGTYRLSTGPRLGAQRQDRGGARPRPAPYRRREADRALPVAVPLRGLRERRRAHARCARALRQGAGNRARDHPGDLFAGEKFEFAVLFDGQPLAGKKVDIYRSPMDLSNQHSAESLDTDAQGRITWTPARPGIYLPLVRHRATAPAGAAAPMYGHNYTLTFRVLDP